MRFRNVIRYQFTKRIVYDAHALADEIAVIIITGSKTAAVIARIEATANCLDYNGWFGL